MNYIRVSSGITDQYFKYQITISQSILATKAITIPIKISISSPFS